MFARKYDPEASEEMAAAIDRTMGVLERIIAHAQKRGEIIEGDPTHFTLVVGATSRAPPLSPPTTGSARRPLATASPNWCT
ncbi:hypothetical protein ABZT06_41430 [Streptomyces sp. NPDC005483]|uniref:hypothetical protein n=1 Tax=Streptomyces sp. NPDC005483 TaxID=3154882 RepID=UPI0033A7A82C